ncbi:phosphomannomutase/phosphoglucomutase [bacterium]|nr:phosphomannomutase/phosphoglucomutase [bacterium]MBU1064124.1 phosphomannomutase/phosphoglucomutase [bacterium]MBU1634896.1 phosphomannomutase/phosphoglucomutase [bacterium]MBU1872661.1 phosphomannomutase/phosphoglucomutase [bacterium]
MNPYIFREYDIRGVVAEDFPEDVVILIGKAYGTYVREKGGKTLSLSGDVRLSTPMLKKAFAKGLLSTGVDVIDVGIVPTPVNYYSMFTLDVDGAVQITGSHNPSNMNGIKLSFDKKAVYGKDIQYLKSLIESEKFITGKGHFSEKEILEEYKQMVISKIKLERPVRIVMDSGNATACLAAPEIFKAIGCEVTELFSDIDGSFPNHHPDPTVAKNLVDMIAEVKKGGYDFGIAFDGDADRVGIVDNTGEIIWADYIIILMLDEIFEKYPGTGVVFDVKCSQALEERIIEKGGRPIMWKTGHSLIKQKMKEEDLPFSGEMSGHIFIKDDYYGFDDAMYVGARFAQMVSRSKETLAKRMAKLPKYFSTPEMRLECENDEIKFEISRKASEYFKANYECIDVDGVRIKFGDGWGLVRSSNTQPVIVTRFEAKTEGRLNEIKELVLTKLQEFGKLKIS